MSSQVGILKQRRIDHLDVPVQSNCDAGFISWSDGITAIIFWSWSARITGAIFWAFERSNDRHSSGQCGADLER